MDVCIRINIDEKEFNKNNLLIKIHDFLHKILDGIESKNWIYMYVNLFEMLKNKKIFEQSHEIFFNTTKNK